MFDMDNDRMFVTETAIRHKLGTKEEIELYEELSLALELMGKEKFNVVGSGIGNGIDFSISTPYPYGLPENVGTLFFNVSTNFDVKVKETSECVYNMERHFEIKLKKV